MSRYIGRLVDAFMAWNEMAAERDGIDDFSLLLEYEAILKIVDRLPTNEAEFCLIPTIKSKKFRRWGHEWVALILLCLYPEKFGAEDLDYMDILNEWKENPLPNPHTKPKGIHYEAIKERLTRKRDSIAHRIHIDNPQKVLCNYAIDQIAREVPRTVKHVRSIWGVGPWNWSNFGMEWFAILLHRDFRTA